MPKKLFITISPPNRTIKYSLLKFKNPLRCVFLDDKQVIVSMMNKWRIKHYVFYPELDPKGRLHYHGRMILSPKQEVSFYKSIRPNFERNIGFVDVSEVKNDLENLLYCMKDWGTTSQIIEEDQPIRPQFLLHNRGRKEGFKSQRDLDIDRRSILQFFSEHLEGL